MARQPTRTVAGRQWQCSPVFDGSTFDNLYALNRAYLDLLVQAAPRPREAPQALDERIAWGLTDLEPPARRALAQSPFSLFDARFVDGDFWTGLTRTIGEPSMADAATDPVAVRFAQMALFYAWHLTCADPIAARTLLGMSDRTRAAFTSLSLTYLLQLACERPELIAPRWQDRETVWFILLGAASLGPQHMSDARMFGIQLIAGDLADES